MEIKEKEEVPVKKLSWRQKQKRKEIEDKLKREEAAKIRRDEEEKLYQERLKQIKLKEQLKEELKQKKISEQKERLENLKNELVKIRFEISSNYKELSDSRLHSLTLREGYIMEEIKMNPYSDYQLQKNKDNTEFQDLFYEMKEQMDTLVEEFNKLKNELESKDDDSRSRDSRDSYTTVGTCDGCYRRVPKREKYDY
jgi:ribosomal protein L29